MPKPPHLPVTNNNDATRNWEWLDSKHLDLAAGDGLDVEDGQLNVNAGSGIFISVNNKVAAQIGDGLEFNGSVTEAAIGDGLEFNSGITEVAIGDGLEFNGGVTEVAIGDGLEFDSGVTEVAIGDGLEFNSGATEVALGDGLEFSSGDVQVDETVARQAGTNFGQFTTSGGSSVAATQYRVLGMKIAIPWEATLTGLRYRVGVQNGSVIAYLADSGGTVVANSNSTGQSATNAFQDVAFTSTYDASPGIYYIALHFGATGGYFGGIWMPGTVNYDATDFSTETSITTSTNASGSIPMMHTY